MGSKYAALAMLSVSLCCSAVASAADQHRMLVLNLGRSPNNRPGADHHRLLVLEVGSGKVLAEAELGTNTSLALSPQGDVVATLSEYRVDDVSEGGPRLKIFRAADLKLLETGLLPASVPRFAYEQGAARDIELSPDGQAIIVQGAEPGFGVADLATTLLHCVKREVDAQKSFTLCHEIVKIPRCHGVSVLRVADWPKVHIWDRMAGLLEVVDFSTGKILSTLPLGSGGSVVANGGRSAYYLPRRALSGALAGLVRQVDLTANPPEVVRKSEDRLSGHGAGFVLSEAAGALFLVTYKPSREQADQTYHVRVFSTAELKLRREFDLSFTTGGRLEPDTLPIEVSRDGNYLYALNPDDSKLAVIEIASGREVKVMDGIGKYPFFVIALPEPRARE